ncbi:Glycoside hydrolase family 92 protein [Mycena indigotica]|uniref:Glycoside hydrolase family 92 protein n=1 Tax=Mycena indigotica TaxID=2126181 RepID=A0A8H6VRX2_9AGAR|nr:Glycoside hydrolase family 92 protein [Mycena indigotica]KAF7289771.1 Glycoside hydrolase family 92 protein [Mycena indigotica]
MRASIPPTILLAFVQLVSAATSVDFDPLQHVNLFIGTINGGNTFPGATVPHGMVKVGMDTDGNNFAGYDARPQFNVTGFSQLHQSGTGGAVPLSNFKLFPVPQCSAFEQCLTTIAARKTLRNILPDGSPDDFASPGYFSTNLSTGVRVELTATRRTALHRYTFPANSTTPRILLDITNDGQVSGILPELTIDPMSGRMQASANFATSFGFARYDAYACVDFRGEGYSFDGPTEWGPYKINYPDKNGVDLLQHYYSLGSEHGGLMSFPKNPSGTSTILARVGISFVSTAQACENAEEEIPQFDFAQVLANSEHQWRDILGRVQVDSTGVDKDTVTMLYSSLYRTHIVPGDYTGENAKWKSAEPYYDAFYCNWDTYRTLFPLMSLHDPENFARIVRGMIDIQKHEGWLPEGREAGQQQFIQGGSHGDPILGEFFVKYSKQAASLGVSATDLYNALLADAENTPPNWNLQGRQADVWKTKDGVERKLSTPDTTYPGGANTKQVSRAIEYAFDDFAISQVAKTLGKKADAKKYAGRAQNYHNSWNANVSLDVPGFFNGSVSGFFQPKFANGTWNFTDPRHCSVHDPAQATCFLNAIRRDGFYESSPIVYSQYVPQDTANLIALQGGNELFIERLNWIFNQSYFDSTNEPSQQIPFMYHYANAPGLSTQRSRQVISAAFNTSLNGLPGNDDSGAMASYVFFYLAGMYPLPATKQILLSSPYFPSISFTNPLLKKTTTIKVTNFVGNPSDGTGGTVFVKSVKVNGKAYKSNCYLEWDVFTSGSTVELELTDDINVTCGKGKDALPPSLSTGGYD